MSILKNRGTNSLNPSSSPIGRVATWTGVLIGCLLLAACQSSNIKSSKNHFLRPTDPPVYHNPGVQVQQPEQYGQEEGNNKSEKPEEVYTITVTEMSVRDLLFALARDANKNIDVYPGIKGRVTLSAIDQTLPQILKRISKQVAIRYSINKGTIIVSPDLPFMKIYEIDYINIMRSSKSGNKISTRLSSAESDPDSELNMQDDKNQSNSTLDTETANNFWQTLEENIDIILNPRQNRANKEVATTESGSDDNGDSFLAGPEVAIDGGTLVGNTTKAKPNNKSGIQAMNKEAGQVSIYASATQHERIQELIDSIMGSVHRQVMIESTVVEVELNDRFQEGVDWDMMLSAGSIQDIGIKGIFSQGGFFSLGRDPQPSSFNTSNTSANSAQAIRAAVKVLETFGNTKVLSSPKIMALNNQPALLKVVKNEVYFTLESNNSTSTVTGDNNTSGSNQTFDTKIHTVPVGLIMSVTPQIAKDGIVTMNVRPTITRITSFKNDPNPGLKAGNASGLANDIDNAIPEIEVKEMETIMRIHSGQVAVMGGLMQDEIVNDSTGLPVLGRVPGLGLLFSHKDRQVKKTELVVFLRPVIIGHDQPQGMNRMAAQDSNRGHIATNPRGSMPRQMAAQPMEDRAPMGIAGAGMAPATRMVPAAAGSYLDFTSPQGFNGVVNTPPPARWSNQSQSQPMGNNGIAPPPAQMALPPTMEPPTMQPAAYSPPPSSQQSSNQLPGVAPASYSPAPYGEMAKSGYFVDLGSFLEQTHADDVQRKVNALGLPIRQESSQVQGRTYQRVRSGPFPNQSSATQAMAKITNYTGIQARVARF